MATLSRSLMSVETQPGCQSPRAQSDGLGDACAASSPASCSGCWSATTNPASKSSAPLDST
jgi:hypothetical protein